MGSFNDYSENAVLNHIFGKATLTTPNVYVGLAVAAISDADTGTTIKAGGTTIEVTGSGYVRALTSSGHWNNASGGSMSNASTITFASSTGAWGTITFFFLADATNSLANIIAYSSVQTAQAVASDNIIQFAVGAISVTLA